MSLLEDAPAKEQSFDQGPSFDERRAAAFAESMVGILNGGALSLLISLGHRSGLFDVMVDLPPSSPAAIAQAAKLNERYVREWLGGMTVGGIVDHDPRDGTYRLPPEHAALLSRRFPTDNMAIASQLIGVLGIVEDDILHCFKEGGGVPYERYHRFHETMAEDSAQSVLSVLESDILPLVPGLDDRLKGGIDVMDAGCGRGLALIKLAGLYPESRFVGYDLSEEAIEFANREAARQGLGNVSFYMRDLSDFDETAPADAFDFVTTFDAVHDQKSPGALLAGIRRSLRKGGVYLAQDIKGSSHHHGDKDHILGPLLYTISCMHCMSVSLAQGGEGLGAMWGKEKALDYFTAAGFTDVAIQELPHDPMNYWYVCRP